MKELFAGTKRQIRFMLRRDRLFIALWIIGLVALAVSVAASYAAIKDAEAVVGMLENPAMTFLFGPVWGSTNEVMAAFEFLMMGLMISAIMSMFFVIRNTRGEEEKGRGEVIRSLPVGRLSNLLATLITVIAINLVVGIAIGLALVVIGFSFAGSMMLGLVTAIIGICFSGIAAVFAQMAQTARGSLSLGFLVFAILYVLRGIGDVSVGFLSYLSPFGLGTKVQAYVGNYTWPLLIILAIGLITMGLAFLLNSKRDHEQGLFPARLGKPEASRLLRTHEGLAITLLKGPFILWTITVFILGITYGSILGELEAFVAGLDFDLTVEVVLGMLFSTMALTAVIPVLIAILKLCNEENNNRYEQIVSKRISKYRIMGIYFAIAIVKSLVMLFATAFGVWLAGLAVLDDPITLGRLLHLLFVFLPAIWVILGLAVLLVGILPRYASAISYSYLGLTIVMTFLIAILGLPEEVMYFSPFAFIPDIASQSINWLTMALMVLLAVALSIAGFFAYRKRDLK